jgi:hypothetical protein
MRNITMIIVISLIATILIINTNYAFAKKNDLSQKNEDTDDDCRGSGKCTIESQHDLSQKNEDTDLSPNEEDCRGSGKCTIESQQQQTDQDMSCVNSAKCINQATSHIVVCKESSLCLVQYDGPFEISNPY